MRDYFCCTYLNVNTFKWLEIALHEFFFKILKSLKVIPHGKHGQTSVRFMRHCEDMLVMAYLGKTEKVSTQTSTQILLATLDSFHAFSHFQNVQFVMQHEYIMKNIFYGPFSVQYLLKS